MREATKEEQEIIFKNIEKESFPTGLNFWDFVDNTRVEENDMRELEKNKRSRSQEYVGLSKLLNECIGQKMSWKFALKTKIIVKWQ